MSRNIGLKDLYIAKITKNDATVYTTETPVLLARAINAKISEKFNSEKNYSDDAVEDITRTFDSISMDLEVNRLTPDKIALIYGQKLVKGMLTGNKEDLATDIAIGFRSKQNNGKYTFKWYYVLSVEDGVENEYATVEGKPKSQSNKIKLIGRGKEMNGDYKVEVDETTLLETDTDAKTAIATWFAKVH